MFNQEADESLVSSQRRAMDAKRSFLSVILVAIDQAETFGHRENQT